MSEIGAMALTLEAVLKWLLVNVENLKEFLWSNGFEQIYEDESRLLKFFVATERITRATTIRMMPLPDNHWLQ